MRPASKAKTQSRSFSAERVSVSASAEDWLNAMDGVAYLVAPDGVVLAIGREGWADFARMTGSGNLPPEEFVGRSLFDTFAEDAVKRAFISVHERVATMAKRALSYEYRCDGPDVERFMKMSVSALTSRGRLLGVLYQSTLASAQDRVPLEFLIGTAPEEPDAPARPFVTICQFCANVTMKSWGGEWVKPTEYYHRGGNNDVTLSHGICPTCERTRLQPLLKT